MAKIMAIINIRRNNEIMAWHGMASKNNIKSQNKRNSNNGIVMASKVSMSIIINNK
jgi:hypothetical protein